MRNFKKFLALVLAMLMVVSAGAAVSAFDDVATDSTYAAAIADLTDKGIVRGKTADAFDPDANVTRWQMALFMVRAITGETDDANWADGFCYFNDIAAGQYPGAIAKAAAAGIILGRSENEFDPTANVNYAEALTMAVRALGYEERDKDGKITFSYPNDYLAKAIDLGLTKGVKVADKYQALTRAETAQIIFNMIYAERNPEIKGNELTFAEEFFGEIGIKNSNTYVLVATANQALEGFDKVDADLEAVVLSKLDAAGEYGKPFPVKLEDLKITAEEADAHFGDTVVLVNFNEKTETFTKSYFYDDAVVTNSVVSVKNGEKFSINGRTYYVVTEFDAKETIKNQIKLYDGNDKDYALLDDTNKLTGNYQLVLADDNHDGTYDRAIVKNLYVSVFGGWDGKKDLTLTTVWDKKTENTYSQDLEKGDVFTYTYNKNLKAVDVVEVLKYTEGKLETINTSKVNEANGSDRYAVKLTIDGKSYTLGNAKREEAGLTGANVALTADDAKDFNFAKIAGKAADGSNDAVDPRITYNTTAQYLSLVLGGNVRFYAIDDQIVFVDNTWTAAINENIGVIKAFTTVDTSAIYADIYMNGELVKDAKIVKFLDKDFSKLNYLTFSYTVGEIFRDNKEGTVVTYKEIADDTYEITAVKAISGDGKTNTNTYAGFGGLSVVDAKEGGRQFQGGIADKTANGTDISRQWTALRANSSTVFYFIGPDKDTGVIGVAKFVGVPGNGSQIFTGDGKAAIYADKIGYAVNDNKIAGVAKTVIVTYTDASQVTGFGGVVAATKVATSVVYVATKGTASRVLGSEFGLTGVDANDNYYRFNGDKIGFNMTTGKAVNDIYVKVADIKKFNEALNLNAEMTKGFIKVDANGVFVEATTVAGSTIEKIEDARKVKVTLNNATYTVDSIISVNDNDFGTIKSDYSLFYKENKLITDTVYVVENTDGDVKTLVVLINASKAIDPNNPVVSTTGAKWLVNGEETNPVTIKVADSKKLAFDFTVYEADGKASVGTSDTIIGVSEAAVTLVKGGDSKFKLADGESAYITAKKDGTFSIVVGTSDFSGYYAKELEAGKYQLTIPFTSQDGLTRTLQYTFEVK